jgi:hypothetical protein
MSVGEALGSSAMRTVGTSLGEWAWGAAVGAEASGMAGAEIGAATGGLVGGIVGGILGGLVPCQPGIDKFLGPLSNPVGSHQDFGTESGHEQEVHRAFVG